MKIILLNPPRRDNVVMVKEGRCMQRKAAWGYMMSPITMVTIATLLRDHGHTVKVVDCPAAKHSFDDVLTIVRSLSPEIIFINTSTPTIDDDIYASELIKENIPSLVKTALFGIHPSCQFNDILQLNGKIDFCIIGEPEFTIRDLVLAIEAKNGGENVAGIAYIDINGQVKITAPREPIANLDELPIPDWSFVDTSSYRLPLNNEKFLLVNTNRGCPYHCTFCNAFVYYGRTPRRRSVAHIMRELENNVVQFGITNFMIWAEEFILDKQFVIDLCDSIIKSGLHLKWVCNSRVDAVNKQVLTAIKNAGCWNIAYGIESGDQNILNSINKNTTLNMIRQAVILSKEVGLQVTGHVILGFPQDTIDTMRRTETFINSLDLDFVQYYCAMPYPGTQLYSDALINGWLTTVNWQQWEHNYSVLDYKHLKASQVMAMRRQMLQRYYFNLFVVFRTLKNHVKRPSDLFTFFSKIRGFIKWM